MADIIDPYNYRDRLTMPKLVVDSGGDEFFMLDDNW
jgi:PhoPQ-activated pathogenicity-related protein